MTPIIPTIDEMIATANVVPEAESVEQESPVAYKRDNKYSDDLFDKIKVRAEKMVSALQERNNKFDQVERAYLIDPQTGGSEGGDGRTSAPRARYLFDPTARNVINRVAGMYLARPEPSLTVISGGDGGNAGDPTKVEDFLRGLLHTARVETESNFIADLLYASSIYGETPAIIENLLAGVDPTEWHKVRTPFLFYVPHPKSSYPQYATRGRTRGLYRHVSQIATTYGEACLDYPDLADIFNSHTDDDEAITLVDYMDHGLRAVWCAERNDTPALWQPLPDALGIIPRVSRISTAAPSFLTNEDDRRIGLLDAYVRSNLWSVFNILYTLMYTNVFDYVDPSMLITGETEARADKIESQLDYAARPMHVKIVKGEGVAPMQKILIPPELLSFAQTVDHLRDESMYPRFSLPGGGTWAASAVNLLSNLSRLTIRHVGETTALALTDALNKTLCWIKAGEYQPTVRGSNGLVTLTPSDIGDCYIEAELKPDQTMERQITLGLAIQMKNAMGLGEDDTLRILEDGGLIDSVARAKERMFETVVATAERAQAAKMVAGESERLKSVVGGIGQQPLMPQPMQGAPNMAMPIAPAPSAPMPAGTVPPDLAALMTQQGASEGEMGVPTTVPLDVAGMMGMGQ